MITCLECGKSFKVLKHTHFRFKCTGTVRSTEEYLQKHPNAMLVSDDVKRQMCHSESSFISRYGEAIGKIKWIEYCKKLSDKCTLEGFLSRGKTESDWQKYNASRAVTRENMIRRHGEEAGNQLFQSYCDAQRRVGKTLDWYVETYGEVDGTARYLELNTKKAITLPNMIKKYGSVDGRIRYDAWKQATQDRYVSNMQRDIIKAIIEIIPSHYMFHDGVFGKEFCVYQTRPYMYDFVVSDPIKLCIEINGDFYHANPKKYDADDVIHIRGTNKQLTAAMIWEQDRIKREAIERRGFVVRYIWEDEWNTDHHEVLQRVVEWLTVKE